MIFPLEHGPDDMAATDLSECDRFGVPFAAAEGGGEGLFLCGCFGWVERRGLPGWASREQCGDNRQRQGKIVSHDVSPSVWRRSKVSTNGGAPDEFILEIIGSNDQNNDSNVSGDMTKW
jgi:hypothetical protein